MPKSRADYYLELHAQREAKRRVWHPVWEELAEFIQPRKSGIGQQRSPGMSQTDRLFDSTAIHANELLAASMQGSLTSSAQRWFALRIRGLELAKDHDISLLLEQCANLMYDEIRQSNHASEFHELYQDMPAFGIGGLFVDENPPQAGQPYGGIRHTAMHPGEFCIEENAEGYVDTVDREFKLSARAAYGRWGDKLGTHTKNLLEKDPTQLCTFLHCVHPNTDYPAPTSRKHYFPFTSVYVDVASKKLIEEGGFYEWPFLTPRWSKTSGEVYGRGPGFTALPDIKTLNKAVELKLRGLALNIQPPLKVRDQGVIGTVKLQPAGLTYVRDMDAVQALDMGGRFDVAAIEEDKLRTSIRRIFFSDQLQLQEGPQMTAYEVQVRYELMQRVLGPTLGRIEVEALNIYVERVFWIMLRRSAKDSPFHQLATAVKTLGLQLDIEYEGPLARAQRLQESVAAQRFFNIVLPLSEANPDALDLVNLDEAIRLHAVATGVPTRILNTPEQVDAIRDGKKQARDAQSKQQMLETLSGAAGKAAPLLKALNESQAGIQNTEAPSLVPSGVGA